MQRRQAGIGTPALSGQRAAHLMEQLKLSRGREPSNDFNGQMREITGKPTDTGITCLANHYAGAW
jgi:hypothetical protein